MADDNGIVQAVEKNTKTLSTSLAGVTSALNNAGIVAKETNISQEERIKNEKRVEAGKKAWETRRAALEDARAKETKEHEKRVEGGRQAWQTRQENEQKKQGGFFQKLLGSQLTPAQQKEKSKDEQSWMKNLLGKPLASMRDTLGGLAKNVGGKAKAGLKGLLAAGAMMALLAFLNSDTWKEWKTKLIPKLTRGLNSLTDGVKWIGKKFDEFGESLQKAFSGSWIEDALRAIGLDSVADFLCNNLAGVAGVLKGLAIALGVAILFKPFAAMGLMVKGGAFLFSKAFGIAKLGAAFLGIGKGVNSAAADVTGKTSKHLGKKGLLSKAFSGLFGAIKGIGPMVAGLAASATAGAKSILDRAKQSLGLGKDKITKQPKIDSFKSMPKQPTGGLTSKPSAALTERSQVKPVRTKVKTLTKAVTKGGGTSATSKVGSIGSKIANVSKKFPKLGALLKFPGIGMVIGVAELAALLLSNKSKDGKIQGVAGILMGMGGGALGALAGGIIGGALGPIGSIVGATAGGIVGYFGGGVIGKGLAQWMMGAKVDAFPSIWGYSLNDFLNEGKAEMKAPKGGFGKFAKGAMAPKGGMTPAMAKLMTQNPNMSKSMQEKWKRYSPEKYDPNFVARDEQHYLQAIKAGGAPRGIRGEGGNVVNAPSTNVSKVSNTNITPTEVRQPDPALQSAFAF